MRVVLAFLLNLAAVLLLFLVFLALLSLVPGLSQPVLLGWSLAKLLAGFAALYLVALAERRVPMLRLKKAGR